MIIIRDISTEDIKCSLSVSPHIIATAGIKQVRAAAKIGEISFIIITLSKIAEE